MSQVLKTSRTVKYYGLASKSETILGGSWNGCYRKFCQSIFAIPRMFLTLAQRGLRA